MSRLFLSRMIFIKIVFCFWMTYLFLPNLSAQYFERLYGEPDFLEGGIGCHQFDNGRIFLVGHRNDGPFGRTDILVYKLDSEGNVDDEFIFGTSDSDYPNSIQVVADRIFIFGETTNSQTISKRGFLAEIDTLGNLLRLEEFGTPGKNTQFNAGVVEGEQIYFCGYISGDSGSNDILVQATDEFSGNGWKYIRKDSLNEVANSIGIFPNGQLIVACDKQRLDGKYNVLLLCLDRKGRLVWELDVPVIYNGGSKKLIINQSGNAVIVGEMSTPSSPSFDMYLLEVNQSGEKLKELWIPGTSDSDAAFSILEPAPGSYLLTGYGFNPAKNQTDIPVVSVDSTGKIVAQKYYGRDGFDIAYDIRAAKESRSFLVAGTVGDGTDSQMALIYDKIDLFTGTNFTLKPQTELLISATVSAHEKTINFNTEFSNVPICVYDLSGRLFLRLNNFSGNQLQLPSTIITGYYLLKIEKQGRVKNISIFVP